MRKATTAAALLCLLALNAPSALGATAADQGQWVPSLQVKPQGQIQLDLFEDGTAFAYNTNDTPLWYSPTGGLNWVALPPPPSAGGTPQIDFSAPDLGYTLSGGTVFATTDKGLVWEEMGKLPFPQRHDSEWRFAVTDEIYAIPGSDDVVVAGHGFYVRDGCPVEQRDTLIWRSADRGMKWDVARVRFPALTREVEFLNVRTGLALLIEMEVTERRECGYSATGVRSSVLLTKDGGRTFREIHSASYEDGDAVTAVAMPSPRRIVLGTGSGRVLLSTDEGRRFKEVASLRNQIDQQVGTGSHFGVDALTFGTNAVGYAGTNGGGTWRTEDGGMTWILEPSHQSLAGLNIGDIAAVGANDALAGGAWAVARRVTQ